MQVTVRTRRPRPVVLVVTGLVLLVAGVLALLTRDGEGDAERDPTVAAVCGVAELARVGDTVDARRVLLHDVHGPLHTLAQEGAADSDRAAATTNAAEAAGRPAEGCT